MNKQDKKRIVAELIETRGKLQRAQLELALDGEDTSALEARQAELDATIDEIRRALHRDWRGRASAVEAELNKANRRVQRRVRDIEKNVRRAERIVSLLGDVEEIIGKVSAILP